MLDRATFPVGKQVLLTDIGHIALLTIFGEQVIERLLAVWADFRRDRFVPFLAVGENRVDIEHYAAEIEHPVAYDVTNPEARPGFSRHIDPLASLGRKE